MINLFISVLLAASIIEKLNLILHEQTSCFQYLICPKKILSMTPFGSLISFQDYFVFINIYSISMKGKLFIWKTNWEFDQTYCIVVFLEFCKDLFYSIKLKLKPTTNPLNLLTFIWHQNTVNYSPRSTNFEARVGNRWNYKMNIFKKTRIDRQKRQVFINQVFSTARVQWLNEFTMI